VTVTIDSDGAATGEPVPLNVTVTDGPGVPPTVDRFSGTDRYGTSVDVSQRVFKAGASVVYIATGRDYADGLVGGPRAAKDDGPLLLIPGTSVPAAVTNEIKRLDPDKIVLLGGTVSISDDAAAELAKLAAVEKRLGGANRYGTAAAVVADGWSAADTVYLASGLNFPDALSGGALAAGKGAPLLLTKDTSVPAETATALKGLHPSHVVILGGTAVVTNAVTAAVRSIAPDATVTRLAGEDRYGTSAAALTASGTHEGRLMLASGLQFADALVGGPAAAHLKSGFALTKPTCLPASVGAVVDLQKITHFSLLGGQAVLSDDVVTKRCS
jgi:putative cell wall-binding protein